MTATETKYEILKFEDLSDDQIMIFNLIIREGMLREQERIIAKLKTLYDITCCCDTSSFGNHYLSHQQPDNIIDFIKKD